MAIKNWLKKTIGQVFDPDKEVRVKRLADYLFANLNGLKDKFSLGFVLQNHQYSPADLVLAQENVFGQFLSKAWGDGFISVSEQQQLQWIAVKLELPSERAKEIVFQQTLERFRQALSHALISGYQANTCEPQLEQIANSAQISRHQLMARYCKPEVSQFILNAIRQYGFDINTLIPAIQPVFNLADRMGLSNHDYRQIVQPLIMKCLEYEIANAKSERSISQAEAHKLRTICNQYCPEINHFLHDIDRLERLGNIKDGNLPRLNVPLNIAVKSGSFLHYVGKCSWLTTKTKQGQIYYINNPGEVVVTDSSLMFSSSTKSFSISFGKIIQHSYWHNKCVINAMNKPEIILHGMGDDEMFYCILSRAIDLYNQQLVGKTDSPSRSIPRDVRQRVWQRDGGKCVECSAIEYLEYDHIIPHSRGGSNHDANIQLLCRRCNGKKSDNI